MKVKKKEVFVYITAFDISVNNAGGINERGMIKAVLNNHAEEVLCIVPYPRNKSVFYDERIIYGTSTEFKYNYFKYVLNYNLSVLRNIRNINKEYSIKACVFRLGFIPYIPNIVARLYNIPIILKLLVAPISWKKRDIWKYELIKKVKLTLSRFLASKIIFADTPSIVHLEAGKYYYSIPENKIKILPNGVDDKIFLQNAKKYKYQFSQQIPKDAIKIVYVGEVVEKRNLQTIVNLIHQSSCNIYFYIFGHGDYINKLLELIKSFKLENRILFMGSVDFKYIPSILNQVHIGIDTTIVDMPLGNNIYYGSYSQKISQYLMMGNALIGQEVEDIKYIEENNLGILLSRDEGEDLKKFSRLINEISIDPVLFKQRCIEYAKKHLTYEAIQYKRIAYWRQYLQKQKEANG